MYNYFKFKDSVTRAQEVAIEQQKRRHWKQKHAVEKQESHDKYLQRVKSFLQNTQKQPFYCEDDHFQQWRTLNLFRETPQQKKFIGFKAFRHKDSKDLSSIICDRQRRQRQLNSNLSEMLVDRKTIAPQLKLRNLRSQGPVIQNHYQFRVKRQTPQPPLRWHSVTDKQRFIENHLPQSKFNHVVFKNYDQKRARIGKTVRTAISKGASLETTVRIKKNPQEPELSTIERSRIVSSIQPKTSYPLSSPDKVNVVIESLNKQHLSPLKKYHFKGLQQLSLGVTLPSQRQQEVSKHARKVLKDCQVNRQKHLENIVNNLNYESFDHPPVL